MTDKITSDAQALDIARREMKSSEAYAYLAARLAAPPAGWVPKDSEVDNALFSQADEDTWMLIDVMRMGTPEQHDEARRIVRAALVAAAPGAADGAQGDGE